MARAGCVGMRAEVSGKGHAQGGEVPRLSFQLSSSLHLQLHLGSASAALVLRRFGYADYLGMGFEVFAEGAAEDSHAGAVDDADMGESGEEGAVYELFDLGGGFIDVAADDVEFGGGAGIVVAEADVDAFAAGGVDRIVGGLADDGGDVIEGDAHLHGADLDFEGFAFEFADDLAGASDGFELDGVSLGDAGDDVRAGVFVTAVGSGGVGDDGLIELLAELAAGLGDAALGFLAELLGGGAVLHGGDGLAGMVLEVAHQRVELLL